MPFMVFMVVWACLVYAPMAHWVWGGGWLAAHGTLDWAGGVPVEMASGFSAFAAAIVVGARKDYGRQARAAAQQRLRARRRRPAVVRLVRLQRRQRPERRRGAMLSFTNTLLAPAATLVVWIVLDYVRGGKATAIGAATAIIVGCVLITPAAGYVSPMSALLLGALGAIPSYFFIVWRPRTRLDETLDVLAAHGISGFVGILFIGLFAQRELERDQRRPLLRRRRRSSGTRRRPRSRRRSYAFVGTYVLLRLIGARRAAARERARRGHGPRRRAARRGGVRPGRRRDPDLARGRVRLRAARSRSRRRDASLPGERDAPTTRHGARDRLRRRDLRLDHRHLADRRAAPGRRVVEARSRSRSPRR